MTPSVFNPGAIAAGNLSGPQVWSNTIGASADCSSAPSISLDGAIAPGRSGIGHHDRERLAEPALAAAQFGDGLGVRGVARQVEAAECFESDNAALRDQRRGGRDRIHGRYIATVDRFQRQARPAAWAGDRLGVKAAIGWVGIFGAALVAHRKTAHRGRRAVVGNRPR